MGEMTKKPTVPAIRFKGFTDTWEQRKLGDIVTVYDGVHQTPNYQTSGVMFLSVENIATLKSNKFISFEDFKRDYKVYPQRNDILMTRIGDVGTTNVVTDNDVKAYYVSLALLKYKETNPFFLSSAIQSDFVQKGLSNRTLKTAIPMKINKDEIGQVDVMLPTSADEQDKIGSFFSQLDTLITLHQRKLDKLHKVKRSLLERMFPRNGANVPEIRFSGFTDAWEQRKFSDFTFPAGEKNKNDLPLEPYAITNEHGFIAQSEAHDDFGYMQDVDRKMYIIVKPNSFAYNPARINVGSLGYYEGTKNVIVSSLYEVFQTVDDVDDIFLNQWFKTKDFMDWIAKLQEGSVRQYFYYDKLCECKMCMPSVEEQQQIGTYFRNLDTLITLHQRKLDKLRQIKRSMLEKMFV